VQSDQSNTTDDSELKKLRAKAEWEPLDRYDRNRLEELEQAARLQRTNDEALAHRVAHIVGPNSAASAAVADLERRVISGEDATIYFRRGIWIVGPRLAATLIMMCGLFGGCAERGVTFTQAMLPPGRITVYPGPHMNEVMAQCRAEQRECEIGEPAHAR
jgi:hypothetical protein